MLFEKNFSIEGFNKNSIMNPRFEFNDLYYLNIVIGKHPTWSGLYTMIDEKISYPMNDIIEVDHLEQLEHNL